MESIDDPAAEQTVERIKGEQQIRIAEEQNRNIKKQEEQRKLRAQKKKNSNTGCGCLIFIVLAFVVFMIIGNVIK